MIATRSAKNIFSIQILRGLAALLVVVHHICYDRSLGYGGTTFEKGSIGVDIFFAISGAVMFMTAPALAPSDFVRRRVIRIVPLYWLFTSLKLMVLAAGHAGARKIPLTTGYILSTFLFIPAFDGDGLVYPVIIAGWTLSFEVYFYLICTVALTASPRHLLPICAAVIACGVLIGLFVAGPSIPIASLVLLSPITLEFIGGMLVMKLWQDGIRLPIWACVLILLAAVVWLAETPNPGTYAAVRVIYWGIPALAIFGLMVSLEDRIEMVRAKPLLLLGDASYALYLSHTAVVPIVGGVVRKIVPDTYFLASSVVLLVAIAVGIATHLLIERPMVKWLAARAGRKIPMAILPNTAGT